MCVCVCVWERESERERGLQSYVHKCLPSGLLFDNNDIIYHLIMTWLSAFDLNISNTFFFVMCTNRFSLAINYMPKKWSLCPSLGADKSDMSFFLKVIHEQLGKSRNKNGDGDTVTLSMKPRAEFKDLLSILCIYRWAQGVYSVNQSVWLIVILSNCHANHVMSAIKFCQVNMLTFNFQGVSVQLHVVN